MIRSKSNRKVIFWSLIFLSSCYFSKENDSIEINKIEHKIEFNINENDSIIDLNKIAKFKWDKLIVIHPYTPIDSIFYYIGYKWNIAYSTHINEDDNFNLLIFIYKDSIVEYSLINRKFGDFSTLKKVVYDRNNSIFKIKKKYQESSKKNWVYLID